MNQIKSVYVFTFLSCFLCKDFFSCRTEDSDSRCFGLNPTHVHTSGRICLKSLQSHCWQRKRFVKKSNNKEKVSGCAFIVQHIVLMLSDTDVIC